MSDLELPAPRRVGLVADYCAWLDQDELRVQQCRVCGRRRHVPRYLCPACRSDEYDWIRCSGEGELFSWTTTERPLHPAFTEVPFTIGVVTLREGPRITAAILDADELAAGLPVRLVVLHPGPALSLPAFHPAAPRPPRSEEDRP